MYMDKFINQVETDVLVIGGGVAGLFAALEAAKYDVDITLVCKGIAGRDGSSINACAAIQVPLGHEDPRDNPEVFFKDVVINGRYLSNQRLVMTIAKESPKPIIELDKMGAPFIKHPDGRFKQHLPPEYPKMASYPRLMALPGPLCTPIPLILKRELLKYANIKLLEETIVTNLLTSNDCVVGAVALDIKKGDFIVLNAKSTVLATGTGAEVYLSCMTPRIITGDGHAMAYRTGAEIVDTEFCKFYMAGLYPESIRGVNIHALEFYPVGAKPAYNRLGEEVDIVSGDPNFVLCHGNLEAWFKEFRAGKCGEHGGLYLDLSSVPREAYRSYGRFEAGRFIPSLGIKVLEIGPSCIFGGGGIKISEKCESNLRGLYAAGDVAGGFSGASYLGGTGFIFALTSGMIAGRNAAKTALSTSMPSIKEDQIELECERLFNFLKSKPNGIRPCQLRRKLQHTMFNKVGFMKNEKALEMAIEEIEEMEKISSRMHVANFKTFNIEWVEAIQVINLINTAKMIAKAALLRTETRGIHKREDYPDEDNQNWLKNIIIKMKNGKMEVTPKPVEFTILKPGDDE